MCFPLDIVLNEGLGHVRFGANPAELEHQLGTPSSVESWKELNPFSVRWTYQDPASSFWFHDGTSWSATFVGNNPALVLITAASSRFSLFGKPIVGETEPVVRSRLAVHGLSNPTDVPSGRDMSLSSPHERRLCYASANLDVYLLSEIVTHVQWSMPQTGLPNPFQHCLA
jgi:hypothetical protein